MTPVLTPFADLLAEPWANGLGATTEVVSYDGSVRRTPSARWRLSVAELVRPGAFSPMPGIRRTLLPVGGAILLSVDGEVCEVPECRPFVFDGGAKVALHALTGPCHAVNLMVDEGSGDRMTLTTAPATDAVLTLALADGDGYRRFDLIAEDADIPFAARIRLETDAARAAR